MSSTTSTNYDGLTRNTWPGTWSPSGNHPIVLDTEIRGSLQSITGYPGDRLTDIYGQRLQEGMMVYVTTTYTNGGYTRVGNSYYTYKLLTGEIRNNSTGSSPNAEGNWSLFSGSTGTQGVIGFTGSAGTGGSGTGYTGSIGSASTATGYTGSTGTQGVVGFTGSASTASGYTGSTGTQGQIGFTGSRGAFDAIGFTGSAGTGSAITVVGNTTTLTNNLTKITFTGTGVSSTVSNNQVTITITGSTFTGTSTLIAIGNFDGGFPNSNYGGINSIDAGGVV